MEHYPGFTLETRNGVHVYRVNDITRQAVDAWYAVDKAQSRHAAETNRHVLRLWYLERLLFPTPYFTVKSRQAIQETPANIYESTAVVTNNPLGFQMMRAFVNRNMPDRAMTQMRLFQAEDEALLWLQARRATVDALLAGE